MNTQPYYSGQESVFGSLNEISGNDAMLYAAIIMGSIVVARILGSPTSTTILGITVAVIIIVVTKSKKDSSGDNFLTSNETILFSPMFKRFRYFYVDQNLLQVIYSIRDWEEHAPALFYSLKKAINEFLHVFRDMTLPVALDNPGENYEKALEYKTTVLGILEGLLLSLPTSQYGRHETVSQGIRDTLHEHMERMHYIATDTYGSKGVNTRTKFLDLSGIQPANL